MKLNNRVRSVCFGMFSKQVVKKKTLVPNNGGVRSNQRKELSPGEREADRKRNRGGRRVARFALGFKMGHAQVEGRMWQTQV